MCYEYSFKRGHGKIISQFVNERKYYLKLSGKFQQLFGEMEHSPVISGGGKLKGIFPLSSGNNFGSPITACRELLNTPAMLGLDNADNAK